MVCNHEGGVDFRYRNKNKIIDSEFVLRVSSARNVNNIEKICGLMPLSRNFLVWRVAHHVMVKGNYFHSLSFLRCDEECVIEIYYLSKRQIGSRHPV